MPTRMSSDLSRPQGLNGIPHSKRSAPSHERQRLPILGYCVFKLAPGAKGIAEVMACLNMLGLERQRPPILSDSSAIGTRGPTDRRRANHSEDASAAWPPSVAVFGSLRGTYLGARCVLIVANPVRGR